MRSKLKLAERLAAAKIPAKILELQGQCIGVICPKKYKSRILNLSEQMGFISILPHEYLYTYNYAPKVDIIIY